jgi:hypothetical protein
MLIILTNGKQYVNIFRQLDIYLATYPDRMHHLDLGLFNYQVIYTREMLKDLCGQIAIDELDNRLAEIPRFPGLKVFKHGLENIKRFTANEFRNMMKVFMFVIEGIITKHKKTQMNNKAAKKHDGELVDVYYRWNKMYLFGRKEYFLESELMEFKVLLVCEFLNILFFFTDMYFYIL